MRGTASYGLAPVGGVRTGFTKKYTDVPTSGGDGENDWIVLRYADVLLMYAETVNEQGAITAPALDAVNRVIRRARGLPVATANPATDLPLTTGTAALRARLETERRLELNFEGHRWFDLVRTDRAIAVMNDYFVRYKIFNASVPRTIDAHNRLFPLPLQELQTNPALKQNDGY